MMHLDFGGVPYDPSKDYYFVLQEREEVVGIKRSEDLPLAVRDGEYKDALDFIDNADPDDLTVGDRYGQTALWWCACCRPMELNDKIKEVWNALLEKLDREAICSKSKASNSTILHQAARKGTIDFIERVMQLDFGKELSEIENSNSLIPLHFAVKRRHFDMCQLFYRALTDPKKVLAPVPEDFITYRIAGVLKRGDPEEIETWKKSYGYSDEKMLQVAKYTNRSMLHTALSYRDLKIAQLLISRDEIARELVGTVDAYNQTPLHWAVGKGFYEISEKLYEKMTPDQICIEMSPEEIKQTVLHFAVQTKAREMVELLLSRSDVADRLVGLEDKQGLTALDWAKKLELPEIEEILTELSN